MECIFDSYTDVGGRDNNEDSLYIGETDNEWLFVVADGLGGHASGEIASAIAAEKLKEHFSISDSEFDLEEAIRAANREILHKQLESGKKMKTTVAVAWIKNEKTTFAHVGDSRIYAFLNSAIVFQSIDHSASQMAVSIGEIKPAEIRNHNDRNILTRALGVTENIRIDKTVFDTSAFDSLLICSDGFWEYVLEGEMCKHRSTSKNPDVWLYKMREEMTGRIPEYNDNNTAIAVIKRGV